MGRRDWHQDLLDCVQSYPPRAVYHLGACGQKAWLFEVVVGLPVKVIARHRQQRFLAAVREVRDKFGSLATVVGVGQQAVDQYVFIKGSCHDLG